MLLLPKEIWDEVAVQSLKMDAELIFENGKMDCRFENLMLAHHYDEANRMWCVRQFAILYLPRLIKKAHSKDLNKFWFVDFLEGLRSKFKDPFAVTFCSQIVNNLRLGPSRDWFHQIWSKATAEWVLEQPKEKNIRKSNENIRFLQAMESCFIHRPEFINWINPYSVWVSAKLSIPMLSISSFKMWLCEESEEVQFLVVDYWVDRGIHRISRQYLDSLLKQFPGPAKKGSLDPAIDVMIDLGDAFWDRDRLLPNSVREFEPTPRCVAGEYEFCRIRVESDFPLSWNGEDDSWRG